MLCMYAYIHTYIHTYMHTYMYFSLGGNGIPLASSKATPNILQELELAQVASTVALGVACISGWILRQVFRHKIKTTKYLAVKVDSFFLFPRFSVPNCDANRLQQVEQPGRL
jgi:hypothetical protein